MLQLFCSSGMALGLHKGLQQGKSMKQLVSRGWNLRRNMSVKKVKETITHAIEHLSDIVGT